MTFYHEIILGSALAGSIAVAVYRLGWFTGAGAAAGGALGAFVVLAGGWAWALPLGVFAVSGSLLSRLPEPAGTTEGAATAPRTVYQVLANGGVASVALMAALYTDTALAGTALAGTALAYAVFAGAVATATADTWATEIGTRYGGHGRAWSLATGQWTEAGASGAVTGIGTAAGALGAGVVGGLGVAFGMLGPGAALWVLLSGVLGSLVDSGLGAWAQAQYTHPGSTRLYDAAAAPNDAPTRGWRRLTNSGVNALATLSGGAIAGLPFV